MSVLNCLVYVYVTYIIKKTMVHVIYLSGTHKHEEYLIIISYIDKKSLSTEHWSVRLFLCVNIYATV